MLVACSSKARCHSTSDSTPAPHCKCLVQCARSAEAEKTILNVLLFHYFIKSRWKGHTHTHTYNSSIQVYEGSKRKLSQYCPNFLLSFFVNESQNAGITYLDLRDGFLNLRLLELIRVNRQEKNLWSPQEFVIFTNRVGRKQAVLMASKLRSAVEPHQFPFGAVGGGHEQMKGSPTGQLWMPRSLSSVDKHGWHPTGGKS